jgi:hypothetical protein
LTAAFAIIVVFTEVWLFAHGRALAAGVFALLALPIVIFALRRERRG